MTCGGTRLAHMKRATDSAYRGNTISCQLAFSPDGKTLVAGDTDGTTCLWRIGG
jgi:WD40 repeat protein